MIKKIEEFLDSAVERVYAKLEEKMKYREMMEHLSVLEKVSVIKKNLDLKSEGEEFEDDDTRELSDEKLAESLSEHSQKKS